MLVIRQQCMHQVMDLLWAVGHFLDSAEEASLFSNLPGSRTRKSFGQLQSLAEHTLLLLMCPMSQERPMGMPSLHCCSRVSED